MAKSICVYCSSSDAIQEVYFHAAAELGKLIAESGYELVYGGGNVGLMRAAAEAVHAHGGRVVGVIPGFMRDRGLAYDAADEMVVTSTMRERKAAMESRADAFVALPGGFGTLEEMMEVLTLKQLRRHRKPVVFLNTQGFYDGLQALFEHMFQEQFVSAQSRSLYHFAARPTDVMDYIAGYTYQELPVKWHEPVTDVEAAALEAAEEGEDEMG